MDDLWKKQGHDLKMTVYKVVPTEANQGLIEFVSDAVTVCKVQAQEASRNATGDMARSLFSASRGLPNFVLDLSDGLLKQLPHSRGMLSTTGCGVKTQRKRS